MLEEWQPSSHSNGSAGSAEDRKAIRGESRRHLQKMCLLTPMLLIDDVSTTGERQKQRA